MSGRKESEVALSELRGRLVNLRTDVQSGQQTAAGLLADLQATVTFSESPVSFQPTLEQIQETLKRATVLSASVDNVLARWSIDENQLEVASRDCDAMRRELGAIRERVSTAHEQLGLQAQAAGMESRLAKQAGRLRVWDAHNVESLNRRCQSTRQEIDEAIRHGRPPESARKLIAEIDTDLSQFEGAVSQRERQHEARTQIVGAIKLACPKLGFECQGDAPPDLNEPWRLKVYTGIWGVLDFELSLDAILKTECSHIQARNCEDWVERLQNEMAGLGFGLSFHYSDTRQPVRRSKAAKDLGLGQQIAARASQGNI